MRPVLSASLLGLFALSSCSTPDPSKDPYGTWIGQLIPDEGQCPTEDVSSLRIRGKNLVFNPGMTSSVLRGAYNKDDLHYHAELIDDGMNHTPYKQTFDAYPVGEGIGGLFTSPRCKAHITLVRR